MRIFFKNTFRPIVDSVEEPEGPDYRLAWEAFILDGIQKCSVCGKDVPKGDLILWIKNPPRELVDFRVCMDCADTQLSSPPRFVGESKTYILPDLARSLFSDLEDD